MCVCVSGIQGPLQPGLLPIDPFCSHGVNQMYTTDSVLFFELASSSASLPRQTFIGRFRRTMDSSQNAYNEDTSALVDRLDCLERVLFRMGQSGLNSFQGWEKGRASHLTTSTLVLNYRKRKMADLQA